MLRVAGPLLEAVVVGEVEREERAEAVAVALPLVEREELTEAVEVRV